MNKNKYTFGLVNSKLLKNFIITIVLAIVLSVNFVYANAITDTLTQVGDQTGLTNYEGDIHDDAVDQRGVRNITSGILFLLDFLKYALGSIALIIFVYTGVKMVVSSEADTAITNTKKYFTSALIGFALIFVADIAVTQVFFGESGEVLQNVDSAKSAALSGAAEIRGIYTFIEMFLSFIAVLTIIISGITMMTSSDDPSGPKKHIGYAVLGLVVVGLSEVFIKDFIFDEYGSSINIETGKSIFASLSNFALSFVAVVSVAAFIYGGYLYVVSFIAGEQNDNAKKVLIGAVAGILISASAYAFTQTLIEFKDPDDSVSLESIVASR